MSFYNVHTVVRDVTLSLLGVIIFISIQFALFYIYKWIKSPYKRLSDLKFSWSLFLLSIASNIYIFIIADFYTYGDTRDFFLRLGEVVLLLGLSIFANVQERAIPYKTKNFFTIIGVIVAVLILLDLGSWVTILRDYLIPVLYTTLFVLFSINIIKESVEPFKIMGELFLFGFVVGIMGYILVSDYILELWGLWVYPFGAGLVLLGITITSLSISKLPSFKELNWASKVKEVYLIHESGVPLFHIDFSKTEENSEVDSDEVLKSGAITSIDMVTQTITKSKRKIQVIDQKDIKILFGHRESLILAVMVEEDLDIIHYKINQFFKEFFTIYKNVPKAIYNRRIFRPARAIALKIFKKD